MPKVKAKNPANQVIVTGLCSAKDRYPEGHNMRWNIMKAIKSSRQCESEIDSTSAAQSLNGVGPAIARMMMQYRRGTGSDADANASDPEPEEPRASQHGFQAGKGPWTLLMALYMANGSGTRDEVLVQLEKLQKRIIVDASVTRDVAKWWSSSHARLQTRGLAVMRSPMGSGGGTMDAQCVLTEEGRGVARDLARQFGPCIPVPPTPPSQASATPTPFATSPGGSRSGCSSQASSGGIRVGGSDRENQAPQNSMGVNDGHRTPYQGSSASTSSGAGAGTSADASLCRSMSTGATQSGAPFRQPPSSLCLNAESEKSGARAATAPDPAPTSPMGSAPAAGRPTFISLLTPSPPPSLSPSSSAIQSAPALEEVCTALIAEMEGEREDGVVRVRVGGASVLSEFEGVEANGSSAVLSPPPAPVCEEGSCVVDLTQASSSQASTLPESGPEEDWRHATDGDGYEDNGTLGMFPSGDVDTHAHAHAHAHLRRRLSPAPAPVVVLSLDDDDDDNDDDNDDDVFGGDDRNGGEEGINCTQLDPELSAAGTASSSTGTSDLLSRLMNIEAEQAAKQTSTQGTNKSQLRGGLSSADTDTATVAPGASLPSRQFSLSLPGSVEAGIDALDAQSDDEDGDGLGMPDIYGGRKSLLAAVENLESQEGEVQPALPPLPDHHSGTYATPGRRASLAEVQSWGEPLWEVVLVIDGREHKDGTTFENHCSVACETSNLGVGDFAWIARHTKTNEKLVLDCVVERKTIADLAQSIKDGRYQEQRQRIYRCGIQRRIYLVEGAILHDNAAIRGASNIKGNTIASALVNTHLQFGIHVLRTASPRETGEKLGLLTGHIHNRYLRSGDLHRARGPPGAISLDAFNVTNRKNSAASSVREQLVQVLFQLPGLSASCAGELADQFGSLPQLVQQLRAMPRDTAQKQVAAMRRAAKGLGATAIKKVGPVLAHRICEFFLDEY